MLTMFGRKERKLLKTGINPSLNIWKRKKILLILRYEREKKVLIIQLIMVEVEAHKCIYKTDSK